jgi:N-acetylglucosamine-6-phosphate deacetylase
MKTTGYIDLQVNGYAGVDFNAESLSLDDIRQACVALRRDGVAMILATDITDEVEVMAARLRRLARARTSDPLAPECDPGLHVTRYFAEAGVRVAAGHTDASLEILRAACDAGLSLFTHLGNGCPSVLPRHDNIIQRALALRDRLWFCFIADGAHVPFFVLRNYLALTGSDRAIIVTDAMAAAGMPPGRFRLGRLDVEVGEDRVARLPGSLQLAGAAVPMALAAANLIREIGLTAGQIHQLTTVNPCAALGLCRPAAAAGQEVQIR